MGNDPQEMGNGLLAGFKVLTYMDSLDLRSHPIMAYGEKISKIIYYGGGSGDVKFLQFCFNDAGKLVCVLPDGDL